MNSFSLCTNWDRAIDSAGVVRKTKRWSFLFEIESESFADFCRSEQAVSYFELAANLGDPDAQLDLAHCCANGKGCKKDLKKSVPLPSIRST